MLATQLTIALLLHAPGLETRFSQVAPVLREAPELVRSRGQARAVVLLHGLYVGPFKKDGAARALLRDWQKPGSILVARLAREADVFAFAYAQTTPAEDVAGEPALAAGVERLRALGYREIVLVGYSAGGLIARHFVEDRPHCGVTKVIQVCAPNAGSGWAALPAVRAAQAEFLGSLTRGVRRRTLSDRGDRTIPPGVEFACVVGALALKGDGLVTVQSQWSEDLQRQGVPAYPIAATHWHVMRSAKGAELIGLLVATRQPRWTAEEVARARKQLLRLRNAPAPADGTAARAP